MFVSPTMFPIFRIILAAIRRVHAYMHAYKQTWSFIDIGHIDYNPDVY